MTTQKSRLEFVPAEDVRALWPSRFGEVIDSCHRCDSNDTVGLVESHSGTWCADCAHERFGEDFVLWARNDLDLSRAFADARGDETPTCDHVNFSRSWRDCDLHPEVECFAATCDGCDSIESRDCEDRGKF